jgi:hypothetical protein
MNPRDDLSILLVASSAGASRFVIEHAAALLFHETMFSSGQSLLEGIRVEGVVGTVSTLGR